MTVSEMIKVVPKSKRLALMFKGDDTMGEKEAQFESGAA